MTSLAPYRVVVDPYAIARRDPSFMAALLLADEVVTILPHANGDEGWKENMLSGQLRGTNAYLSATAWTVPLYHHDIILTDVDGDHTSYALTWATEFAQQHVAYSKLFQQKDKPAFESSTRFVEYLCTDYMTDRPRLGPYVVTNAALDAFTLKHGLVRAKGTHPLLHGDPFAAARTLFSYLAPIIKNPNHEQILAARDILKDQLHPLRLSLKQMQIRYQSAESQAELEDVISRELLPALVEYRSAFESRRKRFLGALDGIERDAIVGVATLTGSLLLGLPGTLSALGAVGTTAATAATRYWRKGAEQVERQKSHMFGFLAAFESS